MAIKASATITLSFMVDIKATYRYYKLQASTASAPSVPTTNPPNGWTDTEPSYISGSTNTLYIVDLTIFTNDTYVYSAVSKSSSYEAANNARNTADKAQNAADNASKVATNYINYDAGLTIGNLTDETLTKNVFIDADSVDIRDGETVLASFGADRIELGNESSDATISMRNDSLVIANTSSGSNAYTQFGCYGNFDVSAMAVQTTELYKKGGILTTIEAKSESEWQDFVGYTWNSLSGYTWGELNGEEFVDARGTYFETRLYADDMDGTTSNGFRSSRLNLRTLRSTNASGVNSIVSEVEVDADAFVILNRMNIALNGTNYINSAWTISSDNRLKKDINEIPEVFVEIWKELEPKTFKWNELNRDVAQRYQFGLIAQDVIEVFAKYGLDYNNYNLVVPIKMKGTEYFSITYDNYHMLTSLVLKHTLSKVDSLQEQINELKLLIQNGGI